MVKCSECGYENIDGLDYCDGCGAKLPVAASAPAGGAPNGGAAPTPSEASAAEPAAPAAEAGAGGAAAPASEAPTGEITPPPAAPTPAVEPAAAVASAFKAKLQIVRGEGKGQELPLDEGNNVIGRWDPETGAFPEVDLDKYDPEAKVSRKHALLRIDGGKITVEDMGSLNGTYVNRQPRLAPGTPVELKSGDEIIIGKTFLKLVVDPIS